MLGGEREVIALDLPGFGETPPLPREVSIPTLAGAVTRFLAFHALTGLDVVGSSMGARLRPTGLVVTADMMGCRRRARRIEAAIEV